MYVSGIPSYGDIIVLMDLLSLFTTGGDQSSSYSSGDGRNRDIEDLDILGPDLLFPTSELRDFVKTPFRLTRERRQEIQNLGSDARRRASLEQNPETPISLGQNPETPACSVTAQAESNTPIQPEKKGPLSKLFAFLSLPEDQFKFSTPRNNEVAEQEQMDFTVPNPQPANIASSEFIHDQSYDEDVRDNLQLNTYIKTHMEGKPNVPVIWNHSDMDDYGIIWNYSDLENMTSPVVSDTAEVTVPYTQTLDPIQNQVTQPVSQIGGAIPQTGGAIPQTGGAVGSEIGGMIGAVEGVAPQTGGSVFIVSIGLSHSLPTSQTGNVIV